MVEPLQELERILLVDDNPLDILINCKLLKNLRVARNIDSVESGSKALDYLEHCTQTEVYPDLLLLDINTPLMSGFEFLDRCQEKGYLQKSSIRIILLTSSTHANDRQKAEQYGVNYLEKPLAPIQLLALLGVSS